MVDYDEDDEDEFAAFRKEVHSNSDPKSRGQTAVVDLIVTLPLLLSVELPVPHSYRYCYP